MLRIKELLNSKGVGVGELANKLGIHQPSMSNILNGKTAPSIETLSRIATVLDVHITELFEQPKGDSLNCPKCGTPLVLVVK